MINEESFRDVMAAVCSPVAVVTAAGPQGPHGTTVSALSSLSLRPPMLTLALERRSRLLEVIRGTRLFGVCVLSAEQDEIALGCARSGNEAFTELPWSVDHGVPRIEGANAWLVCKAARFVGGGDHVLVLGEVIHADRHLAAPLVYHNRSFGTYSRSVAP